MEMVLMWTPFVMEAHWSIGNLERASPQKIVNSMGIIPKMAWNIQVKDLSWIAQIDEKSPETKFLLLMVQKSGDYRLTCMKRK